LVAITATRLSLISFTTKPEPRRVRRRGRSPGRQTNPRPSIKTVACQASIADSGSPSDETLNPSGDVSAIRMSALADSTQSPEVEIDKRKHVERRHQRASWEWGKFRVMERKMWMDPLP
jgi:hypothetical protein